MALSLKIIGHEQTGACATLEGAGSEQTELNLPRTKSPFRGRAAIITLGCAKNQVDSEVMLGVMMQNGYEIVTDTSQAEVIIVNTCGFLESSVKESVDRILEAAELKEKGRCRQLLVAGCMVERYRSELLASLPEVDSFVSVDEILKVADIAAGKMESVLDRAARPYFLYDDTMPRYLSTASHTAYVKISDGCNRPCAFCIIPRLRGAMRSRAPQSVIDEVRALGQRGVREVNLIAQDLTAYGSDLESPAKLSELLYSLDKLNAVEWIRLLYAYPIGVDDRLIQAIRDIPSVVEYLDIPLQHSSDNVLRAMRRPLGQYSPRSIVDKIKSQAAEIKIRTTFIVGFPGETEEDVRDLESFIEEGHFEQLGVFKYSREAQTPADAMLGQISDREKESRYKRLMKAQQRALSKQLDTYVGQQLEVMIEGPHEESELLLRARTRFQAPDIDNIVIVNDIDPQFGEVKVGQIGQLEVTEISGYDLVGRLLPKN